MITIAEKNINQNLIFTFVDDVDFLMMQLHWKCRKEKRIYREIYVTWDDEDDRENFFFDNEMIYGMAYFFKKDVDPRFSFTEYERYVISQAICGETIEVISSSEFMKNFEGTLGGEKV